MITALLLVSRILESIPPDTYTVPVPDLEITRGGGGGAAVSQKNTFWPVGPRFGSKISGGGGGPPLDPPLLHTNSLSERI